MNQVTVQTPTTSEIQHQIITIAKTAIAPINNNNS